MDGGTDEACTCGTEDTEVDGGESDAGIANHVGEHCVETVKNVGCAVSPGMMPILGMMAVGYGLRRRQLKGTQATSRAQS